MATWGNATQGQLTAYGSTLGNTYKTLRLKLSMPHQEPPARPKHSSQQPPQHPHVPKHNCISSHHSNSNPANRHQDRHRTTTPAQHNSSPTPLPPACTFRSAMTIERLHDFLS